MTTPIYTFEDLKDLSFNELKRIKKEKLDELYNVRNEKYVYIQNILSIQGMIKKEKEDSK